MGAVSEFSGTIVSPETRPLREVQKGFTPFQEGDILFAKITPCMENGKAAIARNLVNQRGYGSTEFHVMRPTPLVLAEWIFAIVRTKEFRRAAASSFQGAVGQQRVTASFLESFRIPLPPLSEQQRIVEILQEAEEIRRLRTQAEAKTAELIPALFSSIFGDLYFGESPFPVQLLSTIGELDRGRSRHRPRDEASLYGGPYPFLQTGDIAQSNGWVTNHEQTYSEKGLEQSKLWPKGTLAITIAANIGSTAILTFDACFPDSVVGFKPNKGISAEYVRWWLLGYQKKLEIQAPQGAQKNINLEVLRAIRIPVPPSDLQMQFQSALQNLREQIDFSEAGDKTLTKLSASLSAHAFSGQLTAPWRDINRKKLAFESTERDVALSSITKARVISKYDSLVVDLETMDDDSWGYDFEGTSAGVRLVKKQPKRLSDLNREQNDLLSQIKQYVNDFGGKTTTTKAMSAAAGAGYRPYFTAERLSDTLGGPLKGNTQRIAAHLEVFATRGLVIPLSRRRENASGSPFAACYRLPRKGSRTKSELEASGLEASGLKHFYPEGDNVKAELMDIQRRLARGAI